MQTNGAWARGVLTGMGIIASAWSTVTTAEPDALSPIQVEAADERGSLTVPTAEEARTALREIPGAVDVVGDDQWQGNAAHTLRDVLAYTPGVFAQPKWGEDTRLSIRGSGLSRNFHLRGIQLLQDGVPINTADGSGDFQEIDPTAYRYTEVYKGANALRYGATALGGAINFVSPTGRDASPLQMRLDGGSFGFRRLQASSGGQKGNVDAFVTGSRLSHDGFRDHSAGESKRLSANVGWRMASWAETRLYLNVNNIDQQIPGTVTRDAALNDPKTANPGNVLRDYARNIESRRLSSKTTLLWNNTQLSFGAWINDKDLIHPIFQFLDYNYRDTGLFARAEHALTWFGLDHRLTAGTRLGYGRVDNRQFENLPGGERGALLSSSRDSARTSVFYLEDAVDLNESFTAIAGLQYVFTDRQRHDRLPAATDTTGENDYHFANPRLGVIWRLKGDRQVFANVSRSGEAPTFAEINFTNAALADTEAQRATTFEVGTRGSVGSLGWDLAVYRAYLRNEFQFFDLGGGNFSVTNADDTIHQGIELGLNGNWGKNRLPADTRLDWRAAYTLNDFHFDGDDIWGDNDIPGAPRHLLFAELVLRAPAGFYAGPNLEWVPQSYFADNANTLETSDYALLGLRAGYDHPGDQWSLYVNVRNLADKQYIASSNVVALGNPASALFEPGSGRALHAGINLHW